MLGFGGALGFRIRKRSSFAWPSWRHPYLVYIYLCYLIITIVEILFFSKGWKPFQIDLIFNLSSEYDPIYGTIYWKKFIHNKSVS